MPASLIETTLANPDGSPLEVAITVDDTNGICWRFRLNQPSRLNNKCPWEFIGGSKLVNTTGTTLTPGAGTSFVLGAASLTVPFAGLYTPSVSGQAVNPDPHRGSPTP